MAEPNTYISVRLPRRVVDGLKQEAIRRGASVNRIVGEVLDRHVAEVGRRDPPTVALRDFIGCLSGAPDDGLDSSMVSEVFAEGMVEKHRAGNL